MSASDEVNIKKKLVEVNLPQSWPWKQNGTTVVAAATILKVENNWRSMLQINILKKSLVLNPNHFPGRKCMLLLQYLSDWCPHGIYAWQKFQRKNISNWVIIWVKLNCPMAAVSALQCFCFFWTPAVKATCLQELAGCFRPRLSQGWNSHQTSDISDRIDKITNKSCW